MCTQPNALIAFSASNHSYPLLLSTRELAAWTPFPFPLLKIDFGKPFSRSLSSSVAGRQLLSTIAAATNELFAPTVATAALILEESSQLPKPKRVKLLALPLPSQQQQQQQ